MSLVKATAKADFSRTGEFLLRFRSKLRSVVERSQEIALQEAKRLVAVDTGELRDSIQASAVVDNGDTATGSIEASADHGGYVEFGTGVRGSASAGADLRHSYDPNWPGMPAQPYLRPAMDVARKKILEEFSR